MAPHHRAHRDAGTGPAAAAEADALPLTIDLGADDGWATVYPAAGGTSLTSSRAAAAPDPHHAGRRRRLWDPWCLDFGAASTTGWVGRFGAGASRSGPLTPGRGPRPAAPPTGAPPPSAPSPRGGAAALQARRPTGPRHRSTSGRSHRTACALSTAWVTPGAARGPRARRHEGRGRVHTSAVRWTRARPSSTAAPATAQLAAGRGVPPAELLGAHRDHRRPRRAQGRDALGDPGIPLGAPVVPAGPTQQAGGDDPPLGAGCVGWTRRHRGTPGHRGVPSRGDAVDLPQDPPDRAEATRLNPLERP